MELIDREKLLEELKKSADHHEQTARDGVLMFRDRQIVREQPVVETFSKEDVLFILDNIKEGFENAAKHYEGEFKKPSNPIHEASMYGRMYGFTIAKELIQDNIDILRGGKNER